jgi:hypothetical protein
MHRYRIFVHLFEGKLFFETNSAELFIFAIIFNIYNLGVCMHLSHLDEEKVV